MNGPTSTPGREAGVYAVMDDASGAAAELMHPAWERLEIPYENGSLTGWFWEPKGASGRLPTLVLNNGSDAHNTDMVARGGRSRAGLDEQQTRVAQQHRRR